MLKNLKLLREKSNLSQKQLADVVKVSQQSINKYENHDVEPNIETLSLMANFFNTSIDYIVGRAENENSSEDGKIFNLNKDEEALILSFRKLKNEDKDLTMQIIKRIQR